MPTLVPAVPVQVQVPKPFRYNWGMLSSPHWDFVCVAERSESRTLSYIMPSLAHFTSQRRLDLLGESFPLPSMLVLTRDAASAAYVQHLMEEHAAWWMRPLLCRSPLDVMLPDDREKLLKELARGPAIVVGAVGAVASLVPHLPDIGSVSVLVVDGIDEMTRAMLDDVAQISDLVGEARRLVTGRTSEAVHLWPGRIRLRVPQFHDASLFDMAEVPHDALDLGLDVFFDEAADDESDDDWDAKMGRFPLPENPRPN